MRAERDITNAVVVITGASSGIGRATACSFAAHHARLVLAARGEAALREVADACEARGADVEVVPTDISDPDAVDQLRRRAIERFGAIDVWIEAASLLIAGPFGSEPVADDRRLIETNVLGSIFGARAALATFEEQRRGVLIIVSSILGLTPSIPAPVYSVSKFAMRGLALNLRHAVAHLPDVHVCAVLPGPTDTPIFQRGANYTGHRLRAIPPACAPERLAAAIISCARRPRRQTTAGLAARSILLAHRVAPRPVEWGVARWSAVTVVRPEPEDRTTGALFDVSGSGAADGGWRRSGLRRRLGRWWGVALAERRSLGQHPTRRPARPSGAPD